MCWPSRAECFGVVERPRDEAREILRRGHVGKRLRLTAKHRVATPVNWQLGEDVVIAGSVSNDEAKTLYPDGWEAPRPYIRIVPSP